MQKKYFLILFSFCFINSFSQKKSIVEKYDNQFKLFDSLNIAKNDNAINILIDIQKTKDYNKNDTLKILVFSNFALLNLRNSDKINDVIKNCDECIKIALKNKMYDKASKCAHNKASAYYYKRETNTSIVLDKIALKYAAKGKDTLDFYISKIAIAKNLALVGNVNESNKIISECLPKIKDKETKGVALLALAINYKNFGARNLKLDKYYKASIHNLKNLKSNRLLTSAMQEYCNYLTDKDQYSDILKYTDSMMLFSKSEKVISSAKYMKARSYYGLKDYSNATLNINQALELDNKNYDAYYLIDDYKVRGKIFLDIGKTNLAVVDLKKSKELFSEASDKALEAEVLKYYLFASLKNLNTELYKDFNQFVTIRDSIYDKDGNDNLVESEAKFRTLEKESKIKTQQLQIQKEKANKYIAFGGIGLLLLLSGGSYFWFRNKQKQSNLKTQNTLLGLQQNLVEAELSNLNKQLDPHEIKNLLASISPEIQEKAPESYKKMLKLFNLTKASLNSNSITDSIENQLQQIDDFLSLEKSMMSIPLEYSIENKIQNTQTQIPRLLLKNLVENALKHGIKQQEIGGNISVQIEEKDNFIYISVDDSGKGRNLEISLDSGIGTTTYQKLFATLNPKNKENATFEIIDKQQGTKVEVKIPLDYKYV